MTTYLVTGGAGFIGSNFIKHLLTTYGDNIKIVVIDALTYAGNLLTLKEEIDNKKITFHRGDICDETFVSEIFAKYDPDFVVNFAAESHVDRSINNPRLFLQTNILGTQNMMECARRAWMSATTDKSAKPTYKKGKKYLQISTDEVYGSLSKDFDTAQPLKIEDSLQKIVVDRDNIQTFGKQFFTEDTPLSPRSPYSASKASADMIVMAYHDTYNLPVNITRCSNNYGPYHFPEKLIPLIIRNILQGKKLPVYGKGDNVRDWLYVDDHARAIDLVLRKGEIGEIYNIGGFNEEQNITIVKTVIDIIAKIMNDEPRYQSLLSCSLSSINYDLISFVSDRLGHDMRYAINPTKIATQLGWYPKTTFKTGIEKTVRWYLDNQDWVENVTSGDYMNYYKQMYDNR